MTGWAVIALLAAAGDAPGLPPAAKLRVEFGRHVEPILRRNCVACHGAAQQMNGLRLDRGEDALRGGKSGRAIEPGNSAASRLIQLVGGLKAPLVMPPAGARLEAKEVAILRAWIDQGAKWGPAGAGSGHWAFQPIRRPPVPAARNRSRARNPIDHFILARLGAERLTPSPEADRATLLRRLSLDLIGLPPAPAEAAEFLSDSRPDAYERAADRLLASPHYGEKWARHWLDLARYADSDGYEGDRMRPHAWRYRHWVIEALNRDLPFDQFTIEQLAGDLLPSASVEQRVATGFHRNTLTNREGGVDTEQFRVEQILDRTATLGTVWLGLTVGCAQCHDHKYEPITQKEFYRLFAFFNTGHETDIDAPLAGEMGPYLERRAEYEAKREALLKEYCIADLQREWERKLLEAAAHPGRSQPWDRAWKFFGNNSVGGQAVVKLDPARRTRKQQEQLTNSMIALFNEGFGKQRFAEARIDELRKKLQALDAAAPVLSQAQTVGEFGEPRKTRLLRGGDFRDPGEDAEPGTPAVLPPLGKGGPARLGLARWLVARENPLTARVTVNRMWQELFGRGLVRTSEDFGTQGEKPSHPELLDWLASEFIEGGWSLKRMHRLMVTSATYRQSSRRRPDVESRDPDNVMLARQSRLRLSAELIRDSALAASGLLNPALGGKSIRPPLPAGVAELGYASGVKWEPTQGAERYRRGLYIHLQRTVPYPQLMTFDAPDAYLTCSRRQRSNTPLQALNLLNDPLFFEAAQGLALRMVREAGPGLAARLDHGFRLCLGRPPTPAEREQMGGYLDRQIGLLRRNPKEARALFPLAADGVDPVDAAAWAGAARVILNLDEFMTRE